MVLLRILSSPFLIIAVGLGVGFMLMLAFLRQVDRTETGPNWEDYSAREPFDPMLLRLDSFERAALAEATSWRLPVGTENGAFSYDAQSFADGNDFRGGRHTGDDLNGIGGENSDYGDPVFSTARGLVVYTGEPSAGWGRVVLVAHRVEERLVTQMYAHLSAVAVSVGQPVAAGSLIGRIGTSAASDYAHLHWEWREGSGLSTVETAYEQRPPQQLVQRSPSREVVSRRDAAAVGWPSLAELQYAADNRELKTSPRVLSTPQEVPTSTTIEAE